MAGVADLQFTEGFDAYSTLGVGGGLGDRWIGVSGVFNSGNALIAGRFGGQAYSMNMGNFTTQLHKLFNVGTTNRMAAGMGVKFASLATNTRAFTGAGLSTVVKAGFASDATGKLLLINNTNTVIFTTALPAFVANTWHTFEYELSVGHAKAWVDGALVLSETGLALNMASVDNFFLGQRFSSGGTIQTYHIDDIWVAAGATADRVGIQGYKIETIRPDGDITHDWAHSAGATGFGVTDETLIDIVDYNESLTLNATDLFTLTNLSGTPTEILSMQLAAIAHRTDATFRNIALIGDLAGVQSVGSDWALPNTWAGKDYLMTARPGGGAWTPADANALRAGYKVTL